MQKKKKLQIPGYSIQHPTTDTCEDVQRSIREKKLQLIEKLMERVPGIVLRQLLSWDSGETEEDFKSLSTLSQNESQQAGSIAISKKKDPRF
jgi:hypothetical protein